MPVRIHRRSDRGVVLPLTALFITTMFVMVSFAVDLGRLRAERRDLQADADAIALDAVQKINGLTADLAWPVAVTEANASAARNDFPSTLTTNEVQVGTWTSGTGTAPGTFTPQSSSTEFPNAVKVSLSSTIPMYFDLSSSERSVRREAVAVARAQAQARLGSVVAGIEPKDPTAGCAVGVAAAAQVRYMNQIYTRLLGVSVSGGVNIQRDASVNENINCQATGPNDGLRLDAGSYRGLAATDVTLGDLAAQLGFADADALLAGQVTQKEVITATANALQASGNAADAQAGSDLATIASAMQSGSQYQFGSSVGSGSGSTGDGSAGEATINTLDLLVVTATAIDGNNFLGASNDLDLPSQLPPGLTNIRTRISIVEPPQPDLPLGSWRYQGQLGPKTSQIVTTLQVPLAFNNTPVDLSTLGIPGVGSVATVTGNGTLSLVVKVGYAQSTYDKIACGPQGADDSVVDLRVESGAARVTLGVLGAGEFSDNATASAPSGPLINGSANVTIGVGPLAVNVPINLGSLTTVPATGQTFGAGGLLGVSGSYDLNAGGGSATKQFTAPYETPYQRYPGGIGTVGATDSVVSTINFGANSTGTLGTLLTESQSRVVRDQVIKKALEPYLDAVDTQVLQPLIDALGATAGGADGKIVAVRCQVPALADRG